MNKQHIAIVDEPHADAEQVVEQLVKIKRAAAHRIMGASELCFDDIASIITPVQLVVEQFEKAMREVSRACDHIEQDWKDRDNY